MGRLSVGATFPLEAKFGVGKSAGTRNAILISLMSPSSLALPPRSVSIDAAGRGRICNPRAPTGRLGGRQSGEGAATPDPVVAARPTRASGRGNRRRPNGVLSEL